MPSHYFDDVLRTTNGHLDVNHWAPPSTKWNLWNFTVSAQPKKGMSVSHNVQHTQEWSADKNEYKKAEKHTTAISKACDGVKYNFGFASDAFKAGVAGNLFNDGWKVDGALSGEKKDVKKEWKGKAVVSACSPVLSEKARMWANVELEHNQAAEWSSVFKLNLNYDNWHVGVAGEHKKGELTKKHGQIVMNDKNAQYFARVDEVAKTAGAGCSIEHDSFTHSYEGVFNYGKDAKGFMGSPVSFVGGGEYDLSQSTSLGYTWTAGEHWMYNQTVSHKVDDHWKVECNQAFDAERLSTKQPAYDIGFGVSYKI